jgi:uncharacterized membrane protein
MGKGVREKIKNLTEKIKRNEKKLKEVLELLREKYKEIVLEKDTKSRTIGAGNRGERINKLQKRKQQCVRKVYTIKSIIQCTYLFHMRLTLDQSIFNLFECWV